MYDDTKVILVLALVLVCLLSPIFYAGWLTYLTAKGEKVCLIKGFREATVDYSGNVYCVKRVKQTDVVIPLKEVK